MADANAPDLGEKAAEAASEFFREIYGYFETAVYRFCKNFYKSFADVSVNRWAKVIASVVFYILIRPYIEKFFKYLHDRERRKEKEKKEAEKAKLGGKKAKVSANSLRGGDKGKVLGEVDNTDDEVEDDEEDELAEASGVPEWNKMARKRQKKYIKNLQKKEGPKAEKFTEEEIMELLDWSESEGEKKAK
ncbi:uncharacterized protein N7498_008038 [Penicillium cinerascens]|uniref:Protein trafficking Pga2 n=1 Tax=Penicillium cinerascens TaxID=70096 RepID=A0A9W9JCX6_9EURO|nr:uncharacterized protein N7498_008038 [Penicillium cinerascens]KAJ5194600.1 hypothetical protein N7498_008038 [Penicillium cinerascens]